MPGDKLFQEGMLTFFSEVEMIRNTLNNVLKPNGSQAAPARSCYDLFLCNPDLSEGHIVIPVFLAVGRIIIWEMTFFALWYDRDRLCSINNMVGVCSQSGNSNSM